MFVTHQNVCVRCKTCGRKLEVNARNAAQIRDEFSLQCPSCWRRHIYSRDDFERDAPRHWPETR